MMQAHGAEMAAVMARHKIRIEGEGQQTLMLAHGFGCNQSVWQFLKPLLVEHYRLVIFDYVGSGDSDLSAFDPVRYRSLEGYAQDVIGICEALELEKVVFVGHSVSATIGMLASIERPELFDLLIMLSPSPCFLNHPPDYYGGFEEQDLQDLMDLMDKNYLGWASFLVPLVLGTSAGSSMIEKLEEDFCANDPAATRVFAQATFFSDYRHALSSVQHPTLILQSAVDSLANVEVGRYTQSQILGSKMKVIDAEGHSLHMTHPVIVSEAILDFLHDRVV